MSLIHLKNVSARYDDRQVLKEVFFRVRQIRHLADLGQRHFFDKILA